MACIPPNGTGSVYRIKERHLGQIKLYADLTCISEPEKKFVLALVELAHTLKANYVNYEKESIDTIDISRSLLQEWLKDKDQGSGDTILKKRSSSLAKIGLFDKSTYPIEKRKPADLFILKDSSEILHLPALKQTYEDHRPHRQSLKKIRSQLIEADSQILDNTLPLRLARSERLWNGVLGSCMRTSRSDPRKNEHFSTIYRFGSDRIEIVTSTQTTSEICHVDDQRTIRAIITLACVEIGERLDLGKEIKNEFFIDIVDLCELIGLDGSGSNRDTVRDSMERLYSTNFNLKLDSESETGKTFINQFGLSDGVDDLNYRFLTEFDSSIDRSYGGSAVRRPRWYRIALHSKTYNDLVDPKVISTFIDNKAILKVSSGLIHLFYTWCSIHVKRSGNRVISISLPDLHKQISPSSRYDNFRDRFLGSLKQHMRSHNLGSDITPMNRIPLFGYFVKAEEDDSFDYIFTAYRDKGDSVIGDKSMHNRLLTTSIKESLEPI